MSVKRILNFNNEDDKKILLEKSDIVVMIDNDIKNIIQDLKDTLLANLSGVGLSAVQIGELKRICVIKYNGCLYTLINPVITRSRGQMISNEGCLSIPGIYTNIERKQKVWITYMNENGETKEMDQGGLFSAIIQHELDHFEGICKVEQSIQKDKEE